MSVSVVLKDGSECVVPLECSEVIDRTTEFAKNKLQEVLYATEWATIEHSLKNFEQMTRRNPLALAMGSRSASIIFYG